MPGPLASLPECSSGPVQSHVRPMRHLPLLALVPLVSACTITSIGSEDAPPRVEAEGLIEGHAAFGWRDERRLLELELLDGSSHGAVAELKLWRLLRIEVGLLGIGLGVGPVDLALGTLFYEPEVPRMTSQRGASSGAASGVATTSEDCELCRRAREQAAGG